MKLKKMLELCFSMKNLAFLLKNNLSNIHRYLPVKKSLMNTTLMRVLFAGEGDSNLLNIHMLVVLTNAKEKIKQITIN